ncbi:MAG TPA: SH3 domain-containing protein, partial [Caldilinea sp.]|nr:SH3 domain-containing protein [Caldilinea sp.]
PTEEAAEAVATAAPTEEATAAPAEETATAIAPAPGFALVTAEGARLRVRAEPSTTAEIVGWVQPGETVPVAEVSADGLWVKLGGVPDTQNPNGGWVSAEFVVLGQ